MKKKFKNSFIALVLIYVIGVVISFVISDSPTFPEVLTSTTSLIVLGCGLLAVLAYLVSTNRSYTDDKGGYTGKTASGSEMNQHYEARFVSEEELLTNPVFMPTTWKQLPKVKKTGVMIRS